MRMSVKEKFVLKWADYSSTVTAALQELRNHEELFDITLAVENKQILAHKLVLAASSSFFRTVIKNNPHQHPLLYLKGVKYSNLVSILNFMYHGQVSVVQDELTSFLNVAEELNVRGLTNNKTSDEPDPPAPAPNKVDGDTGQEQLRRRNETHNNVGNESRPVELDLDDNNEDNDDDEIKVSKVVNVKKRSRATDQPQNTNPSKRALLAQTTSERLVTPTKMNSAQSPKQMGKKKREAPTSGREGQATGREVMASSRSVSSRNASTDYQEDEDESDASGVQEIRRSKRKSKKRVYIDAVADADVEEDTAEVKVPYRSSGFKLEAMTVIQPDVAAELITEQMSEKSDVDMEKSDIDNLLDNDTNEDESDNEQSNQFEEKDDLIEVKESLKREVHDSAKQDSTGSSDNPMNASCQDEDNNSNLPVLADEGFHNPSFYKSEDNSNSSEQMRSGEMDESEKDVIQQLNEALDDLTNDYLVQVNIIKS